VSGFAEGRAVQWSNTTRGGTRHGHLEGFEGGEGGVGRSNEAMPPKVARYTAKGKGEVGTYMQLVIRYILVSVGEWISL